MFSQVCTIFCFTQDSSTGAITLYPRVLTGVGWHGKTDSRVRAYRSGVLQPEDEVILNIPFGVKGGTYVSAGAFRTLPDKSGYWTLQTDAVILLGSWDTETLRELFPAGTPTTGDLLGLVGEGEGFTLRGMRMLAQGSDRVRHWRAWGR